MEESYLDVPILRPDINNTWQEQKQYIGCLQESPGVYTAILNNQEYNEW